MGPARATRRPRSGGDAGVAREGNLGGAGRRGGRWGRGRGEGRGEGKEVDQKLKGELPFVGFYHFATSLPESTPRRSNSAWPPFSPLHHLRPVHHDPPRVPLREQPALLVLLAHPLDLLIVLLAHCSPIPSQRERARGRNGPAVHLEHNVRQERAVDLPERRRERLERVQLIDVFSPPPVCWSAERTRTRCREERTHLWSYPTSCCVVVNLAMIGTSLRNL